MVSISCRKGTIVGVRWDEYRGHLLLWRLGSGFGVIFLASRCYAESGRRDAGVVGCFHFEYPCPSLFIKRLGSSALEKVSGQRDDCEDEMRWTWRAYIL